MPDRVHQNPRLIYAVGTQVVTLRDVTGDGGRILYPKGAVGVVVRAPEDLNHSYRVRFPDGVEEPLRRDELVMLAVYKEGEIGDSTLRIRRSFQPANHFPGSFMRQLRGRLSTPQSFRAGSSSVP